jgi:8-oxo-dGTP diphosphatase
LKDVVCAFVVNPSGEVLLGLRARHKRAYPGYWDLFGGHVEAGEGLDDALVRELREELAIDVTGFTAIGSLPERQPEIHGAARYHFYLVESWRGEPSNACDEHERIDWFTPQNAVALDALTDGVRELIAAAITPEAAPWPSGLPSGCRRG